MGAHDLSAEQEAEVRSQIQERMERLYLSGRPLSQQSLRL
jgi:hypothetical protein